MTQRDQGIKQKTSFGYTIPNQNNKPKELEFDCNFEQSLNANNFKLDSFRAYGKSYCTSTKGG